MIIPSYKMPVNLFLPRSDPILFLKKNFMGKPDPEISRC